MMSTLALIALVVGVGAVTFFYRYAMIGLFAGDRLPGWLHALCRHIAPASFAALTASALFIDAGAVSIALDAPKPWAALIAALVAWRSGSVLATIGAGMAALYILKLIL
ncbi:AzlD domain-containing protein [Parazoarcus communis]|nr:AzlD domain-containing protein [Parazoarcus communis]